MTTAERLAKVVKAVSQGIEPLQTDFEALESAVEAMEVDADGLARGVAELRREYAYLSVLKGMSSQSTGLSEKS